MSHTFVSQLYYVQQKIETQKQIKASFGFMVFEKDLKEIFSQDKGLHSLSSAIKEIALYVSVCCVIKFYGIIALQSQNMQSQRVRLEVVCYSCLVLPIAFVQMHPGLSPRTTKHVKSRPACVTDVTLDDVQLNVFFMVFY